MGSERGTHARLQREAHPRSRGWREPYIEGAHLGAPQTEIHIGQIEHDRGATSSHPTDPGTYRQQEALDAGSGTKLTQRSPFIGTSGTKLAQHTIKRQFWALFRLQGENSHARSSTKQSRAKIVTHKARKHERLERKIAPARGVKGRRETFFAHARSQQPFLTHFNRAGAMFLSLRMHARHWSNPLGRYFFQDQTKTTDRASDPDAPNQRSTNWRHRCDAH